MEAEKKRRAKIPYRTEANRAEVLRYLSLGYGLYNAARKAGVVPTSLTRWRHEDPTLDAEIEIAVLSGLDRLDEVLIDRIVCDLETDKPYIPRLDMPAVIAVENVMKRRNRKRNDDKIAALLQQHELERTASAEDRALDEAKRTELVNMLAKAVKAKRDSDG